MADETKESAGPTVYTYSPLQKKVLKSNLRSVISNKVDEDPEISPGHRPSALEDFTAMIQPGWSGRGTAEKTKDSIKPKKEPGSVSAADEATDPEGNVEEGNPDLESKKQTTI